MGGVIGGHCRNGLELLIEFNKLTCTTETDAREIPMGSQLPYDSSLTWHSDYSDPP